MTAPKLLDAHLELNLGGGRISVPAVNIEGGKLQVHSETRVSQRRGGGKGKVR